MNKMVLVPAAAWAAADRLAKKFFAITPEEKADREMVRSAVAVDHAPPLADATGTP